MIKSRDSNLKACFCVGPPGACPCITGNWRLDKSRELFPEEWLGKMFVQLPPRDPMKAMG